MRADSEDTVPSCESTDRFGVEFPVGSAQTVSEGDERIDAKALRQLVSRPPVQVIPNHVNLTWRQVRVSSSYLFVLSDPVSHMRPILRVLSSLVVAGRR